MSLHPPLWKVSVHATKAESRDIAAAIELGTSPQAVLIEEEPFEDRATVEALYVGDAGWRAACAGSRGARCMSRCCRIRTGSSSHQEGLPPVRAGRFFVYGAHDAGRCRRA